jgi:A/G-specific adenine glycosylase
MFLQLSEKEVRYFQKSIIEWGRTNSSYFPWRETHNKWHALIAEIMLQRTNAEQVLPVYKEFTKKYKKPEDLLKSSGERLFRNLGLHWREKQIIELAKCLAGKEIPESKDSLLKLPGIGNYIASAYRSLHLGIRDVIIDSNIVRIMGRYFSFKTDAETRRKKWFEQLAERLTPAIRFKEYNYALLDFSRTICRPKPKCKLCVLSGKCKYFKRENAIIGKI